eukprot:9232320-Alexandrium_andersonii.AAC.1
MRRSAPSVRHQRRSWDFRANQRRAWSSGQPSHMASYATLATLPPRRPMPSLHCCTFFPRPAM